VLGLAYSALLLWLIFLFIVSLKFSHVSMKVGGWPLGYDKRRCWANCPCMQLVSQISNPCGPDPPTSDGQTDDMQSQYRALHYSASCGNKNIGNWHCRNKTNQLYNICLMFDNVWHCSLVTNVAYLPLPYLQYIIFLSFTVSCTFSTCCLLKLINHHFMCWRLLSK